MTPERWRQIEALYHQVRAHPAGDRVHFLTGACGDDVALRDEVGSLLEADGKSGALLDESLGVGLRELHEHPPLLGRRVGGYEVLALIGAGGMGDVYRTRDTKLGRDVALKVLRTDVASDPERLARFRREAQVLASLNNPHIAQIYGLEESIDVRALVMELVEGPTLADRIARGAIPVEDALPIAKQVAEALEAAHAQGIVHRDLKPANIKVRPDGTVKVLDFGLAKALEPVGPAADLVQAPIVTSPVMTRMGVILGTAAYMSPEQAAGKIADKRSDLWSFGVVLMEMLTGAPVFAGETMSHVIASVLKTDPDWESLPADTPPPIHRLLRRCLQKNQVDRLGDAGDARLEIQDAMMASSGSTVGSQPRSRFGRERAAWAVTTVVLAGFATLAVLGRASGNREAIADAPSIQFAIPAPEKAVLGYTSISPDGRQVAFMGGADNGRTSLWVRKLDSLAPQSLAGTDGAQLSFWSPDSRSIAFFAGRQLKRIRVDQGVPELVADMAGVGAVGDGGMWAPDGMIVFSLQLDGLHRVPAGGGTPEPFTRLDASRKETRHYWPSMLPDGQHLVFVVTSGLPDVQGVWVASLRDPTDRHRILPDLSRTVYSLGHLLFVRGNNLMAQPFDLGTLTLSGDPVPIVEGVPLNDAAGYADFGISDTGVLSVGAAQAPMHLAILDRAGRVMQSLGRVDTRYHYVRISPDQRQVATDVVHPSGYQIFVFDPSRGTASQLTFGAATGNFPVWSLDGSRLAFGSNRNGVYDIFIKSSSGSSREDDLLRSARNKFLMDWSRDGRFLLYGQDSAADSRKEALWVLPMTGDRTPFLYLDDVFDIREARFSPDGRWVAYTSLEPAARQVFVRSFPNPSTKVRISTESGSRPVWRDDGRELFYLDRGAQLMAVDVRPSEPFQVGTPVRLFQTDLHHSLTTFDAYAGGQRFVMPALEQQATSLQVILNWPALADRRR